MIKFIRTKYKEKKENNAMKLLSESWNEYLITKKDKFEEDNGVLSNKILHIIQKFDMEKFEFEVSEGYPEVDCGLTLFAGYKLTFIVESNSDKVERVTINVSNDFIPVVYINGQTQTFEDYFKISTLSAYTLGELFQDFAQNLKTQL